MIIKKNIATLLTAGTFAISMSASASQALEEIVVTATKRNQSLQEVPSSVSVLTSDDIQDAGIKRANDFLSGVPNVTFFEDNAGEVTINIRGQTAVRSGDPNVAIVVDGVPMVSLKAFNQDLVDLQQIEILKGPQSAVYGRNAAAGAVVITTRDPGDEMEGSINATLGSWDSRQVSGNVSGPLTDTLKYALAASTRETDGPFTSTTGIDVQAFETQMSRLKLLWEPSDAFTVRFRLSASDSDGPSMGYQAQMDPAVFGVTPLPALDVNNLSQKFVSDVKGVFDEEILDSVLDVEYNFEAFDFRSITSFNKFDQVFAGDLVPYLSHGTPGNPFAAAAELTQAYTVFDDSLSQEFRISSNDSGSVQWMVGAYYLKYRREQYSEFNLDDGSGYTAVTSGLDGGAHLSATYNAADKDTEDYALFANMQWDISEKFRMEFAGRYDREKRSIDDFTPAGYSACLTDPSLSCSDSKTFSNFSPKVSLIYILDEDMSVYANYGKGYKAGGFNPIGSKVRIGALAPYVEDTYKEEESDSYELGFKGEFFDGALRINAGAFYTKVTGAQQFEFFATTGDQIVTSVGEVELKGFDIDFQAILPGEVEIFGGYGYTDGELKKFDGVPAFEGNSTPGTMEYNANIGATKDFVVGDSLTLTPRVEAYVYGPTWWDFANTEGTERDAFQLLDARLTLSGENWRISAWGKNLTDEDYFQEYVPLAGIIAVAYRGPTRSYGLDVTYNF